MDKKLSIIVSCIDYRFWPKTLQLLKRKFGNFDSIELAGASKNIASPSHKADRHAILESIKVAVDLHKAKTLILTNHLDCGAYGGSKNFASYKKELDFHKRELQKAKRFIKKIFPKLKTKTVFLMKDAKGKVKLI